MHKIWLTADTHFGHFNIIKYCNRPFTTIEEHDQSLVENWNLLVKSKDTVYHLGDLGMSDTVLRILPKLKGNIHLIKGNHDQSKVWTDKRFRFVKDTHMIKYQGISFWMAHYAHRTWPKMARGCIHTYGHSHGNLPGYLRSLDVGVDLWDYAPVDLDTIIDMMKDVPCLPENKQY
jgi:calcineurin-like phosphoesterase family protein